MTARRARRDVPLTKTDEGLVRVYPHPDLADRPDGAFLPGVGAEGADIDPERAAEWLAAGLATTEAPATPASED